MFDVSYMMRASIGLAIFTTLCFVTVSNEISWDEDLNEDQVKNVIGDDTCQTVVNYCARVNKFPCLSEKGRCISRDDVCNYVKDCKDGSDEYRCPTMCSLDDIASHDINTHCGWRQDNVNVIDGLHWIVMAAYETISGVNISPNVDSLGHSCGKFFALADSSQRTSRSARSRSLGFAKPVLLQSALFSAAARTCTFSFAYTMYDNRARYYLYINYGSHDRKSNILWMGSFAGNYSWSKVSVPIGEQTEPFRLSFLRAPAPHSTHGTIVLDAFSFDAC